MQQRSMANHRLFYLLWFVATFVVAQAARCQSCSPVGVFTTTEGETLTDASTAQDAPLVASFTANPEPDDLWGYTGRYEWKIWNANDASQVLLHRFEQDIDYTFTQSGTFLVQLYATFTCDGDTIIWPEEGEENPIVVVIGESKLEMPNAFSPNGDGYNDYYNAKSTIKSIVEFSATIFNRWGQKIYSWTDPTTKESGWDGKWHGHTVGDGVYYVVVVAKGADGIKYNIRKDVNVLTGYEKNTNTSNE